MNYGRNHDERRRKARPRDSNVPHGDWDADLEANLEYAGRHRATSGLQSTIGVPEGSDVAPTQRATERERMRHRLERAAGRQAAGLGDLRDRRTPTVSRDQLREVARQADRAVRPDEKTT